jgi:hypothetical protein
MKYYNKQAEQFLKETGVKMEIVYKEFGKHFPDDKQSRDIYTITLSRGSRKFVFDFGQSIANSTRYEDKITGNVFSPSGESIKGKLKVVHNHKDFFNSFCKNLVGTPPSSYDVLTCLTKYDPGTFEDFCSDFGYDQDSRTAERIYKAVVCEYQRVCMLWDEAEIENLREIQ